MTLTRQAPDRLEVPVPVSVPLCAVCGAITPDRRPTCPGPCTTADLPSRRRPAWPVEVATACPDCWSAWAPSSGSRCSVCSVRVERRGEVEAALLTATTKDLA